MPECRSTNTYLMELGGAIEGTVVITADQTGGRGQRGNTWESEKGKNITCSILLKPAFLIAKDQFHLNMVSSLALRDLLKEFVSNIFIKWPNDIIVNEKKICGILIENQLIGTSISKSVIGIGLNVNQERFNSDGATSLKLCTGREVALQDVFESLLEKLESWYLHLRHGKIALLKDEYLKSMYWIDQPRLFSDQHGEFKGIIRGVDEFGKLTVEQGAGKRSFDLKEISFVK